MCAQIGDLRFFRSPAYQDYFRHLDQKGGFYSERVGPSQPHCFLFFLELSCLSSGNVCAAHSGETRRFEHSRSAHSQDSTRSTSAFSPFCLLVSLAYLLSPPLPGLGSVRREGIQRELTSVGTPLPQFRRLCLPARLVHALPFAVYNM